MLGHGVDSLVKCHRECALSQVGNRAESGCSVVVWWCGGAVVLWCGGVVVWCCGGVVV